jgi:DNA primase
LDVKWAPLRVGPKMSPRKKGTLHSYDRARIREELQSEGYEVVRSRYPRDVVNPIARLLGLIQRYRHNNVWNPEWNTLLGNSPDADVAAVLGVSAATVHVHRRVLGIRPSDTKKHQKAQKEKEIHSIPDEELRELTLVQLREKYRLSHHQLSTERTRRGIVPPRRQGIGRRHDIHIEMRQYAAIALHLAFPAAKLQDIADVLDISRERVRQILETAQAMKGD